MRDASLPRGVVTSAHRSALGCWTLSTWRPAHLAREVEAIWYSDGTTAHPRERAFPTGLIQLRVNLGDPYRLVAGGRAEVLSPSWVSGLQDGPRVIEVPARHRTLAVMLRPAGAYAVLARPMSDLSATTVGLEDLVGGAARELVERCRNAARVEERFRIVADWLAARIAAARPVDPSIAWAASRIERSAGGVAIRELRAQTGMSKTRLTAAFREQVGLAPKLYARIIRFRAALALLHRGEAGLADVALAAGYYDQPHMNADFRELSGLTPLQFLAARYPDGHTAPDG